MLQSFTCFCNPPIALDWALSMRYRRIVCFLLGAWIGVSAMLALDAYRRFEAVDAVLKSPPEQAVKILKILGPDNARRLLRYTAGVQNSGTFETWETIQLALGVLITLVLFLGSSTRMLSVAPLLMTLLVAFLHFKITPELIWLGRSLEFSAGPDEALPREQFWRLHYIYAILETVKCIIGFGAAVFLFAQGGTKVVRRRRHHEGEPLAEFNRHAASR